MRHPVLIVAVAACLSIGALTTAQELEVHCLDIGHGDCTLIISPTGKTMMIDASLPFADSKKHLCGYLHTLGVSHLDYLIITHYHRDHLGGVDTLSKHGITIDTVYDRGWIYCKSDYLEKYIPAIKCVRHTIVDGQVIELGGGAIARVVSVNGNGQLRWPYIDDAACSTGVARDENSLCVSLVVELGGFEFFVGGDLTGYNTSGYFDIETSVAPEVGEVEVYRVNHHGSKYSTNPFFLETLSPEVSILSVGNNSYHHPDTGVVRRLQEVSTPYQTSDSEGVTIHGDIVIRTDGVDSFYVDGASFPVPVAEEDHQGLPVSISLSQNYPNPFNSTTTIRYSLPRRSDVSITVYNIVGQRVVTLLDGIQAVGFYEVTWDGTNDEGEPVTSGVYLYRIKAEQFTESQKMVLLK